MRYIKARIRAYTASRYFMSPGDILSVLKLSAGTEG